MLSVKDINLLEGQNQGLKKQNKKKKKEVKELRQKLKLSEERHEVLLNEYDELLHKTPENVSNCTECENDVLLKSADLEMRCEKLEWWYKTLNKALDIKDELNRALREENEDLKSKLELSKQRN